MLEITCSADERYVAHAAVTLRSVLAANRGAGVRVHFLRPPDLTAESSRRLAGMVEAEGGEIRFLDVDSERVEGLPGWQYITPAMWNRIFLPELLPEADRVLYLDVDTVVLDSLEPLWGVDLGGHYLAAVTNVFQLNHLHRPGALGLARPQDYFNSGVLLMNLELMRRDGVSERLAEYARGHASELEWPDQDALNVVLGDRRLALHPRWNCMNSMFEFPWSAYVFTGEELADARRRPAIRHFEGPAANKPWHFLCATPFRDSYFDNRRHTPWPDVELEGRTLRNRVRRPVAAIARRLSRTSVLDGYTAGVVDPVE